MRLKKLEIFGFKSFADKTEIVFDEGVTCVVGPNGCGKSNISDSIRWVLGERSAKMLRGSKMEDIIFNGTDFRKPVSMAEVALTIDNADRGLPIDYNEVTIARRLYRSGESEYYINKTLCRLKDIQDLILDTGIGSSSYSMIEQGRIDYILNADADERRFLIEEAAGISKYKVKKEEALRKLERTEENRLRLNDIIQEVHKNIQYSERQARRASRYKEQFEQLKTLEIKKGFYDLAQLHQGKSTLSENRQRIQTEMARFDSQLSECRKKLEALNTGLRALLESYRTEENKRYATQSKMEQNQQQLRFNQETRMELANRRGQIQQEQTQLEARITANTQDIESKRNELGALVEQKQQAFEQLQLSEKTLGQIQAQLDHIKFYLDKIKTEAFQSTSETSKIRNDFHRVSVFLETHGEQRRKHDAGSNRLKEDAGLQSQKIESYATEILGFEEALAGISEKHDAATSEVQAIHTELETLRQKKVVAERLGQEKQTRLNLLREIDSAHQANEDEMLANVDELERQFIQTLRNIFTAEPGYEWALETALSSFSRSYVIENTPTAQKLLTSIREKKVPSLGILIREIARPHMNGRLLELPAHLGTCRPLTQVVKIKEGYENLLEPFFSDVFIVQTNSVTESMQELLPLAWDHTLLTQEGITLGPKGRIFMHAEPSLTEYSPFRRQAEMESLQSDIHSAETELASHEGEIASREEHLKDLTRQLKTLEGERSDFRVRKESLESLRKSIVDRVSALHREIDLFAFESQEIQTQYEKALADKSQYEEQLKQAEQREHQIREQQETLIRDLDACDHEKIKALQAFAEHKARHENIDERNRILQQSLDYLVQHDANDKRQTELLTEETGRLGRKEEQLAADDERLQGEYRLWDQERHQTEIALELLRRDKETAEGEAATEQTLMQELQGHHQEFQNNLHQLEIQDLDLGFQEKTITERLHQAYRISLNELNAADFILSAEETPEALNNKLGELREKVEAIGTVNLLAIEEYEELKQRYDFLMAQQKDLDLARQQLLETIKTINKTTKNLFEETFVNVQNQFREYYQTLFCGGEARLILVDESNPLESGIDIVVRPPGKKLTHITLLSGGEKALTAIALLFALFKIKPSPFCVLDEVDAPLDEANIDRFLTVLRTFLTSSQFIIVTHNRKTIAMGDSLYGVTMQEAGVSKLVSVKVQATDTPPQPTTPVKAALPAAEPANENPPVEEQVPV